MRPSWLLPLVLVGCEYTPIDTSPTDTGPTSCARADWQPARTANMVITSLSLDGNYVIAIFDPSLTVDGQPAACVAPDGKSGKWFFTVGGEPYGSVQMEPVRVGNNELGIDGNLVVDLFGAQEPVRFTGVDFIAGAWVVDSFIPKLQASITAGNAQSVGRFLELTMAAEATP